MKTGEHISGWLALDKPEAISSAKAVAIVKRAFAARKAGHAGTLDPLASGLLPIALGEATKTMPYLTQADKSYRFTIRFGIATNSGDREGSIIQTSAIRPSDEEILTALPHFIGQIEQTPPRFSAVKINGKPAYRRARQGQLFHLAPRQVQIHDIRLKARLNRDCAVFDMRCGKGVYVRAFACDLAHRLNTCAHLQALRRTQYGVFDQTHMIPLDKIQKILYSAAKLDFQRPASQRQASQRQASQRQAQWLQPLEKVLEEMPKITLKHAQAAQLRAGQNVLIDPDQAQYMPHRQMTLAIADGKAIALAQWQNDRLEPQRVFNL